MTILELITIILFFFFFGYGLVRFFMDLTEYVAWRWQKMSEKRFTYFKVPLGFGKQAIKDNANDEVFDFTLSNVLDKLNEQQATIRKLQDLCGESDSENAKLRIENKRLQAENEQLKNKLNNDL